MVTSLNLDTSSECFEKLKGALQQVPSRETVPCNNSAQAREPTYLNYDLAGGLNTPTTSIMTEKERFSLPSKGNAFVVCAGCASMVLLTTGDMSTPFRGENKTQLSNAVVFTFCKACERSGNVTKKSGVQAKLSTALFKQSAAVTIPALIMKEAVPIVCDGKYVQFFCFDEIVEKVGPSVKAFGVEMDIELEYEDPPSPWLLPHLPGRFL